MTDEEVKQAIMSYLEYSLDEVSLDGFDNFTEMDCGCIHVACERDLYFRVRLEPITAAEYGRAADQVGADRG